MSQKLNCPACGAAVTLEQMSQAADLLALARAQAAFGDDWPLVAEYLAIFQGQRALKVAKQLRLAREVWQMWHTGNFCIGGVWHRVGREEFREALRATCNQVAGGLTNHNYLKKVLVAAAEKTSQREERELREREEGLRVTGCKPVPPEGGMPEDPAWRAKSVELGQAVRRAKTPATKAAALTKFREHMEGATDGTQASGE